MIDEGYVKFDCEWTQGPPPTGIDDLIAARNRLHALGLVGEYTESGIGYGNVSKRMSGSLRFAVSGTATGRIAEATAKDFCEVTAYDIPANSVACAGPVPASSESMTHAMFYACDPAIEAVLHVHHRRFWEYLLAHAPCSREGVSYGTPAMAREVERLMNETKLREMKVMAMRGHEEGIIAFGGSVEAAMTILLGMWEKNWGKLGGG
jgi:L-ribulose-5-phosphate 4-epimerase